MKTQEILSLIATDITRYASASMSAEQKQVYCDPRGNEYRALNKKIHCFNAKREALEELMDKIMTLYGEEICVKKYQE